MRIDLSGRWSFDIDREKIGIDQAFFQMPILEEIMLPGTVSSNRIGESSDERAEGHLTDPYAFEGFTWYARYLNFDLFETHEYSLVLERTRTAHVWIDRTYVDSRDSLVSSQEFDLSPFITKKKHRITICVDNSSYPIGGGHMTSKDSQTNWNGITGAIYLEVRKPVHLKKIWIDASYLRRKLDLKCILHGARSGVVIASVRDGEALLHQEELRLKGGNNSLSIDLPETIEGWNEHNPKLYRLDLDLDGEVISQSFGARDFKAVGRHFEINGERTFLRGKHDALVFPKTGYAPTDVESWLEIMKTAKSYGINHYRFHTACPPDAAFTAADQLGIYMEPELPFWGTMTTEADEEHNPSAQAFLISEGFRMLDEFGNHPSFVMMSLGNELWGSRERIDDILATYRHYDPRPLYTQGSNNFQFSPAISEYEDFFVGVRFSRDRLFRASYAMCDAPQGHVQTEKPNSSHNYDEIILPQSTETKSAESGEILIQYGSGTKTVKTDETAELIPQIPVISHEIGQYAMYPDYSEIEKYTGVLKPRNLEIFRERLAEKGLLHLADAYFRASGKLAVSAYKAELEAAAGSANLAGYQILDLQDFPGQGTALVGILNAFMESKGLITPEEWREFCAPVVILASIDDFVQAAGKRLEIPIKLAHYAKDLLIDPVVMLELWKNDEVLVKQEYPITGEYKGGVFALTSASLDLPGFDSPQHLELKIYIDGSEIRNRYSLWVYPESVPAAAHVFETSDPEAAKAALVAGESVLFYPVLNETNSIEGTYCTDFWCYPMFRSISESMNKPLPVGTHGLLIHDEHPLFTSFPVNFHTTAQWYDIVSASRAQILDGFGIEPVVSTIDNVERNHKLGTIWEAKVGKGKLLVVTAPLNQLTQSLPARWLEKSIRDYLTSDAFDPEAALSTEDFETIFSP